MIKSNQLNFLDLAPFEFIGVFSTTTSNYSNTDMEPHPEVFKDEEKRTKLDESDYGRPEDRDPFAFSENVSSDENIDYRTMGWVKAGALIMAETIALGILSFPSVFYRLGMFGGIFTTIVLAVLSWYTGYVLIQFKVNHPGVMNFSDAGRVVAGKYGAWMFGAMLIIKVTFVAGSHALSGGIALKSISSNAICVVAYGAIIAVVSFLLTIPRTFDKVSYISFVSVTAIIVAVFITIVATGVQDSTRLVPPGGDPVRWKAFESHRFIDVIEALTNIIFAYGGHVAIFSFASEMKNPRDFTKSLALVQTVATVLYIIAGATIYSFGGQYVTSPALTMTSKPVRITAYSVALVSIIIAGVVASYVGGKYVFVTMFRNSPRLTSSSLGTWLIWCAILGVIWTLGFIIAEVIPFFNDLLSIISSILTVWFTYGLSGVLWLHDNNPQRGENLPMASGGGYFSSRSKAVFTLLNIATIAFSFTIMVLGMYSAITSISEKYRSGEYPPPFSC